MQRGLLHTYARPISNRGWGAWAISFLLTAFYFLLYLPGAYLPGVGSVSIPDYLTPVALWLGLPDKWFLYGLLYSIGMVVGGYFMLRKHGNSRYHRLRTLTLVGVQIIFAFSLPLVLQWTQNPAYYISYFWPLSYDKLFPGTLKAMPVFMAVYFALGSLVVVPVLGLYKGKRFYCSWICGCGGLAETFGDPWRHLSDKLERAWRFERVSIYSVLALVVGMTLLMVLEGFGVGTYGLAELVKGWYGFLIGAVFSGVVGVGLYPLMGTRVWCRFGCPMAAILGILQKHGRFRIEVKEDMCIGCGNCSAYCEMGIDVRLYAMQNEVIRRASCVGCGMCAHVCPRGVLRLVEGKEVEVGWE